jgi:hypothetical protein
MKYNTINNLVISFFYIALFLGSCTKRIDLRLEEDQKRTVINTRLIEGTGDFKVKVTKSDNYLGENSNVNITNASVLLIDLIGTNTLLNIDNGEYLLSNYTAFSNKEYRLVVTENGKMYEAKGKIPIKVALDSISYVFEPSNGISEEGYVASIHFEDPANEENYYKVEFLVNGKEHEDFKGTFVLIEDKYLDGNTMNYPLVGGLKLSDSLVVNLFSVDKATYTYYEQLGMAIEGDGAAPSNPDNNFGNNTLGHFGLMAVSTNTVVIKE